MRGQQVALDLVGDELQRAAARFARFHALVLQRQPLADPGRQPAAIDVVDLDRDAGALERLEPGGFRRGEVQPRQRDQHHQIGRGLRARQLRRHRAQRLAAFLAWLAGRNAQLDDLAVAEQRHRLLRLQQLAPLEAALGHQHVSLAVAGLARRLAQTVDRLEHQQMLVAVYHVQRCQPARLDLAQVTVEGVELELHPVGRVRLACLSCPCCLCVRRARPQAGLAAASRRISCCTMSRCMSRYSCSSS